MSANKSRFRTLFRYTFEFVAAGLVGWIYEVTTLWIMYHYYDNRGILHLPIIPIYPIGAFILLAVLREKKRNPIAVFLFSAVITTVFELGASYLLEFIFHQQFWTYEGWFGSILDRSSVVSSAIFGVFAVVYFFGLHPLSGYLSSKLPVKACAAVSIAAIGIIFTDFVISVAELL